MTSTVVASTSGRARLRLEREDDTVATKTIDVAPGPAVQVELVDPTTPRPGERWRLVLEVVDGTPDDDTGNNALTLGWQGDRREVLVVGGAGDPRELVDGDQVGIRQASRLSPAQLAGVDLVIVSGAPWQALAPGIDALRAHVERGGQLLLLGGPRAYGPGGWAGQAIDELSPLRVEPPPGDGTLLVLLVDRSGSTADGALAHLKSAARSALLGLRPGERLAVLPFAAGPADAWLGGVVAEAGDDEAKAALLDALEPLAGAGATDIPSALDEAIERAASIRAERRWIVLLTDGDPDHRLAPETLAQLRGRLDDARIDFAALVTEDAVAVEALRQGLARRPEDVQLLGRAQRFAARLRELVRERRLSREALPRPRRIEPIRHAIAELDTERLGVSRVHDLEVAQDAGVLARAIWDDGTSAPFLARRVQGTGAVWAFAWGPAFEGDVASRRAANAALRLLVARLAADADRGLRAEYVGDELLVRLPRAAGAGALPVHRGDERTVLVEREPGLFLGPEPEGRGGLRVDVPGDPVEVRPLRLPVRPPSEHRGAGVDEAALERIAEAGGGARLRGRQRPPRRRLPEGDPIAAVLLVLAAILLVVERILMNRTRNPILLLLLLLVPALFPACRPRPPAPELPTLEERVDRPFYEGTERMRTDLDALFTEAAAAEGVKRAEIGRKILGYGEPARPLLIERLSDPDATMRVFAAWLLGVSDDTRVLDALDGARGDPDEAVRFEAATAMARLGDRRGLPTLVDGLEHPDPRVRSRSIRQLELATGDTFGYRTDDRKEEREAAVRRWRAWLRERERGTGAQ